MSVEQVVFVDSRVPDLQDLIAGLKPNERAFVLDGSRDGVQQIADLLAANNLQNVSSISIVGHGSSGQIELGSTTLNASSLQDHSAGLAQIGAALAPGGDLQLYACDVALGATGKQFIADLSKLSGGVDIAAATHDVGNAALGGSWTLDATSGSIEAGNPFTTDAIAGFHGLLFDNTETETVNFAGSGLVFVNTYTADVTEAYHGAIIAAENFFQSQIASSVTLHMNFGFADFGDNSIARNSFSTVNVSYDALKAALTSHATSADDTAAINSLPVDDPSGGAGFDVAKGMALALGLPMNVQDLDSISLNSNFSFAFDPNERAVAGAFDAISALEHEISEGAFGRVAGLGLEDEGWRPMDLFRYSAPGERDYSGGVDGKATYFSVDGTHLLTQFHNSLDTTGAFDGVDFGDWDVSVQQDAFGYGSTGQQNFVTATDLRTLDILGWTMTSNWSSNNQPPALFVASRASYTGSPVTLSPQVTLTDDNINLYSATVAISGSFHTGQLNTGDELFVLDGASHKISGAVAGTSIVVSRATDANGNETLTLTGLDTVAHYRQVLTQIEFQAGDNPANYGQNPERTVTWQVGDGIASNQPVTTKIDIFAGNQPPRLEDVASDIDVTEGGPAVTISSSTKVVDPDSINLVGGAVTLGDGFAGSGDELFVLDGSTHLTSGVFGGTNILVSLNDDGGGNLTLRLSGSDTLAHYQQVLDLVQFQSTGTNPTNFDSNSRRVIEWQVDDGTTTTSGRAYPRLIPYPTSDPPLAIVAADLNSDNVLDLVTGNGGGGVSVLLGAGDGTFGLAQNMVGEYNARTIAVGDFNGDGKPDIAAANSIHGGSRQNVSLRLGNGDGTFGDITEFNAGSEPISIAAADFNRDGKLDIIVANSFNFTVSVLLGRGDGTFDTRKPTTVGTAAGALAVADLNGDGIVDLAVTTSSQPADLNIRPIDTLAILHGVGDGTFSLSERDALGTGINSVAIGDLNHDGKPDIAVTNTNAGTVSILLNTGAGGFGGLKAWAAGPHPTSVSIADTNGDGNLDLVVTNADFVGTSTDDDTVSILLGKGDGTFANAEGFGAGAGAASAAIGDFNGDRKADVAVADAGNQFATFPFVRDYGVSVLLNHGVTNNLSNVESTFIAIAAVNDPPVLHDVAASATYEVVNPGPTTLSSGTTISDPDSLSLASAAVQIASGLLPGDVLSVDLALDGGGYFDSTSITGTYDPTTGILSLTGTDSLDNYQLVLDHVQYFSTAPDPTDGGADVTRTIAWQVDDAGKNKLGFSAQATYPAGAMTVATGDLNGDGHPDLVATATSSGDVSVLLGRADGSFSTATSFATGATPSRAVIRDFDGDGKQDVAVADKATGDGFSFLHGAGDGTFAAATLFARSTSHTGANAIASGDFDGDGHLDVVITDSSFGTFAVWLGDGHGQFSQTSGNLLGNSPKAIAVGDFDGDGKSDLVVVDDDDETVSILLGRGDGSFSSRTVFPVGRNPYSVAIGDLNGDGKPDLAVAGVDLEVSVLLGTGDGGFEPRTKWDIATTSNGSVAIADFNDDGKLDLSTTTTDGVAVLLGNGDGTFGKATQFAAGSRGTSMVAGDFDGDGKPDLAVADGADVAVILNRTVKTSLSAAEQTTLFITSSDAPSVRINQASGQADPTTTSPVLFDVVFDEPVAGFDASDIDFTGSTVGGTLVAAVAGGPTHYVVSVSGMTGNGTIVASIAAGAAQDAALNPSNASTSTDHTVAFTTTVDTTHPSVTINQTSGQADPTSGSPILFDVVFDEAVAGFDASDIDFTGSTVGGTLVAAVTGGPTHYVVSVSGMTGNGTVVATIAAGAAQDAALNPSNASTSTDHAVTFASGGTPPTALWAGSPDYGVRLPPVQVAGVGDFNHDGTDDVLWHDPTTGPVDEWVMQNGQWSASISLGTLSAVPAGIGDFNGDGTADVLWRNPTTGAVDEWKMQNGQWAGSVSLGSRGADWTVAGVGDFNRDGTADVLWRNVNTGQVDEWQMKNGQWSASIDLGSRGGAWQVAGIGDFNGDGTADVLWRNPTAGAVDEWTMQNGQWAGSVNLGSRGTDWTVAGVGDFNQDGTADVLWRNPVNGQMDGWVMFNGQWSQSMPFGPFDASYIVAGIGDFNGAGGADVLWRDPLSGQTGAWLLTGADH